MADFTQQINDFQNNGIYNYQFDEAGNQVLNPSSSVFQEKYLSFPTINNIYDESKILVFYDPKLTEFQPSTTSSMKPVLSQEIIDQVNQLTENNLVLQNQLESMIAESETISTSADQQAIKDIVLGLRFQLGQGSKASDFQSEFPYLPTPLEEREL